MWWVALFVGLLYGIYHIFMSFHQPLKEWQYYYYLAGAASLCIGLTWGYIARSTTSPETVYKYGAAFDGAIVLSYYLLSIWLFNMKFSIVEYVGVGLVAAGMVVLKLGGN